MDKAFNYIESKLGKRAASTACFKVNDQTGKVGWFFFGKFYGETAIEAVENYLSR